MRRVGPLLLVLAGVLLGLAPEARAKELPELVRRMAESAFLEGRLEDLDTILAGAREPSDRLPLLLRDSAWRRSAGPLAAEDEASLSAWLKWTANPEGPQPLRSGGGDPYPILTALVQDRTQRETQGRSGLPQTSPLVVLSLGMDPKKEERAIYFLAERTRDMMLAVYRGEADSDAQRDIDARAETLRSRNGRWALWALGLFLVISAGFVGFVGLSGRSEAPTEA